MFDWKDVKNAKLGGPFERRALKNCCKAVYGGVSWPDKRPGFAVVVAMNHAFAPEIYEICLLEEFESFDMRELIRQCGLLHSKYEPYRWFGDTRNDSAEEFMFEMRDDSGFRLSETDLTEKEPFYDYVLGKLKELRDEEHRRLFLKNSKVRNYMAEIEQGQVAELKRGDFPPLEALIYAAVEGLRMVENLSAGPYPTVTGEVESYGSSDRDLGYSGAIDTWDPEKDEDYGDEEAWYHTV